MAGSNFSSESVDPLLAQQFYRQLILGLKRLDDRKFAKRKLDEHLSRMQRTKGPVDKKTLQELSRHVDSVVERERSILHKDNKYLVLHQDQKKLKQIEILEEQLALLEERYEIFKKKGLDTLQLRKIEARIEFMKTKLAFLRQ